MPAKVKKEFLLFAVIGVFNTLTHAMSVIAFVELFQAHPTLANTLAFFVANTVSYFLNSRYTFKAAASLSRYKRFLLASSFALLATVLLSSFAEWMHWHYLIGLMLVIFISPVLTFTLQKQWTFKEC